MSGQAAHLSRDEVRAKIKAVETNSQVKGGKKSKGMEKC
jgi:hypothetical protein